MIVKKHLWTQFFSQQQSQHFASKSLLPFSLYLKSVVYRWGGGGGVWLVSLLLEYFWKFDCSFVQVALLLCVCVSIRLVCIQAEIRHSFIHSAASDCRSVRDAAPREAAARRPTDRSCAMLLLFKKISWNTLWYVLFHSELSNPRLLTRFSSFVFLF